MFVVLRDFCCWPTFQLGICSDSKIGIRSNWFKPTSLCELFPDYYKWNVGVKLS